MEVLKGIEPQGVFEFFEKITSIPHGSGNTKKISNYIKDFALKRNLKYYQDEKNNVIIYKDATEGYENSDTVILQGHIDMVCEKVDDYDIDMENEGLRLKVDGDIISAEGTTLGGDDGIAVAYMLAILDSNDIPHPPIECVFTVDEEIGMLGAAALDMSKLKGRTMLNIDSEEEGIFLSSCAGGIDVICTFPFYRTEINGIKATVTVDGLKGGHSGLEIDKGRANANQILGRVLYNLNNKTNCRLLSVNGGKKGNVIPSTASAELVFVWMLDSFSAKKIVAEVEKTVRNEYKLTDPDIRINITIGEGDVDEENIEKHNKTYDVMRRTSGRNIITALYNMPGGIQKMSFDIDGLVETSLNLGILETLDHEVKMLFAVRSSVESEKNDVVDRIKSLSKILGGKVECEGNYPAWEYREDSPLRKIMVETFKDLYGYEPEIEAVHAGVECGLFSGNLEGLDTISYGPDMKDIHTYNETLSIESAKRTWLLTLEVLKRLK